MLSNSCGNADRAASTETVERIRKALKEDLAECDFSRAEVVYRLNATGGKITVALLDAYVAESKSNRFPADLIPIWVAVMQSRRILDAIAGEVGLLIATAEDREFAELGRAQLTKEKLVNKLWSRV